MKNCTEWHYIITSKKFTYCGFNLQAIEAKNLIGNYDTSMYLKAQVDNLQGRNDELRRELRETRHECNKVRVDLQRAKEKVSPIKE